MKYLFVLLAILMFMNSCKSQQNKQNDFFIKTIREKRYSNESELLVRQFEDTLKNWININIESVQVLKSLKWCIDKAVFFDEQKHKAIILILEKDTSQYLEKRFDYDELELTSFDYIKLIYANKTKDSWDFYYKSLPLLVIPRNRISTPNTFNELSTFGRIEILTKYYKNNSCIYNPMFFNQWDIENLKIKHTSFLSDKISVE